MKLLLLIRHTETDKQTEGQIEWQRK